MQLLHWNRISCILQSNWMKTLFILLVFHLGVWSPYPINVAHYLLDNLHFSIEEKDEYGLSPLALSSYFNGLDNVEYLVNRSANVQTIDFCGRTPLHLASLRGNLVSLIIYFSIWKDLLDLLSRNEKYYVWSEKMNLSQMIRFNLIKLFGTCFDVCSSVKTMELWDCAQHL